MCAPLFSCATLYNTSFRTHLQETLNKRTLVRLDVYKQTTNNNNSNIKSTAEPASYRITPLVTDVENSYTAASLATKVAGEK